MDIFGTCSITVHYERRLRSQGSSKNLQRFLPNILHKRTQRKATCNWFSKTSFPQNLRGLGDRIPLDHAPNLVVSCNMQIRSTTRSEGKSNFIPENSVNLLNYFFRALRF
ncbi:hypothetical protein K449DRAFT_429208 [Hypoxylon sp. EC38]|nr:hypothetical protein K449DRAFT_429208 [Hypoxylon sp. EC38]